MMLMVELTHMENDLLLGLRNPGQMANHYQAGKWRVLLEFWELGHLPSVAMLVSLGFTPWISDCRLQCKWVCGLGAVPLTWPC